jgi:hypothetical protein
MRNKKKLQEKTPKTPKPVKVAQFVVGDCVVGSSAYLYDYGQMTVVVAEPDDVNYIVVRKNSKYAKNSSHYATLDQSDLVKVLAFCNCADDPRPHIHSDKPCQTIS